jgi:hypothetical protein
VADDWFKDVRDAVATAFAAKLTAESVTGVSVKAMDVADVAAVDLPAVIVSYNGSEQEVGGTNVRDDYGYPIQLGLYTVQADNGISGTDSPPGMSATQFRQYVRAKFHRKRAVAVTGIDCFLCEYDPTGAVVDEAAPTFQQLRAVAVVTVYARVPRGS